MDLQRAIIQMKATDQYFPVVLFIMFYKVVVTFKSVDKILKCDLLNESYQAVISCGIVHILRPLFIFSMLNLHFVFIF